MAIVDLVGQMVYPRSPMNYAALPGFSATSLLIDAADEAVAVVLSAPRTGNIRKIGWATRTVTTGATVDVRVEQLTSGFPNGTLWSTTTNGSQVVLDANDNTFFLTTLTSDAAVTKGQLIAVVIKNPSASFGNMVISGMLDDQGSAPPFTALYTGAWAQLGGIGAMIGLEYDDGTYAASPGCYPPATAITANTISSVTSPNIVGVRFKLPVPCRAVGAWTWFDVDGICDIRLVTSAYNGTDGILGQIAVGITDDVTTEAVVQFRLFPTAVDLDADTFYRLVCRPSTSNSVTVYDLNAQSLAALSAWNGPDWVFTTASSPTGDGDWTNYNSGTFRYPLMGLLIGGFDAGGGGGLLTHPGMSGGMRG